MMKKWINFSLRTNFYNLQYRLRRNCQSDVKSFRKFSPSCSSGCARQFRKIVIVLIFWTVDPGLFQKTATMRRKKRYLCVRVAVLRWEELSKRICCYLKCLHFLPPVLWLVLLSAIHLFPVFVIFLVFLFQALLWFIRPKRREHRSPSGAGQLASNSEQSNCVVRNLQIECRACIRLERPRTNARRSAFWQLHRVEKFPHTDIQLQTVVNSTLVLTIRVVCSDGKTV